MRELEGGPFLELQFFFPNLTDAEALSRLTGALVKLGATFAGIGYIHQGPGVRDMPFRDATDDYLESIVLRSQEDIDELLLDPDVRLVEVGMGNAIPTDDQVIQVVKYSMISEEASRHYRHPLVMMTEGWMYEGTETMLRENEYDAKKTGLATYRRFKELIIALEPAYGSIDVEWGLDCPIDLRRDPSNSLFIDFFVSDYVGEAGLAQIGEWFRGSYIEPIGRGLYVSCYRHFNPQGLSSPHDQATRHALSTRVAELIGSAWEAAQIPGK